MTHTSPLQMVNQRLIDGPVELVFKAWTDADHITKWWGPRGFTTTTKEINIQEGGVWRYTMHGPDGTHYPNRIIFKTITLNTAIIYDHDNDNDNDSFAFVGEVRFEAKGEKTLVTTGLTFKNKETYDMALAHGAKKGGIQHLQRFEEHVLGLNGFTITREFNSTPSTMFDIWTHVNHLSQWMGPKGSEMEIISGDISEGSTLFYKMSGVGPDPIYGKITYLELSKPYRLQYIQHFTDKQGTPCPPPFELPWPISMKTTVSFEPYGDKTKLSLVWITVDASKEEQHTFDTNKDNMTIGWTGSFDTLETYITNNLS